MRERGFEFVKESPLQFALREFREFYFAPRTYAIMAAITMVLTISGPFNTLDTMGVGPRAAYWAVICLSTFGSGMFFSTLALAGSRAQKLPIIVQIVLSGLASAIPTSSIVFFINFLSFPGVEFELWDLLIIFIYCMLVGTTISLLMTWREIELRAKAKEENGETEIRLLKRLPLQLRAPLISISVQDHYVEVTSEKGKHLVLMRLSDAIAETEGMRGFRIHRSHWVAQSGIKAVHKRSGKFIIETTTDQELPVSRTYVDDLKTAEII